MCKKAVTKFLALISIIKYCAKGTIYAPVYANIIMTEFEEKYISPLIKNKSILLLRFIDNIFMIWNKSKEKLSKFRNLINQIHQSIKFDLKFSKCKIGFLDTLVYKDKNNGLHTTLFKKPSDQQNYLWAKSAHLYSLKKALRMVKP